MAARLWTEPRVIVELLAIIGELGLWLNTLLSHETVKEFVDVGLSFHVAIVDRSLVEHFGYELRKASSLAPSFKRPQLVMLGHVGQSLPSQQVLADLGCCACFSRPPRQSYLRDALSVALSGGSKLIRVKTDFTLDTGHLVRSVPMNGRYSTSASSNGLVSASSRSKIRFEQQVDSMDSPASTLVPANPRILVVARQRVNIVGRQQGEPNDGSTTIESPPNKFLISFAGCSHCGRPHDMSSGQKM